ncbi:MAG: hypothetical protein WCH63_07995 [Actinomycetota bacterium]
MSDKAAEHWTATHRLLRSTVTKDEADRALFGDHVFKYNSPIDHEHILVVFFGFIQSYFASLGDTLGSTQTQELWSGFWSDWKDITSIHQKVQEFHLLETAYMASVAGTFMSEGTDRNSTSRTRSSLVTMASTPGTTSLLPMVACMFFDSAFDICDEGNAPIFRQTMKDAVNHGLK